MVGEEITTFIEHTVIFRYKSAFRMYLGKTIQDIEMPFGVNIETINSNTQTKN